MLREDTALDEYPMPDPAYSKEDVDRDFACLEGYLLPLSKERAEELMERDFSIYAIVNEYDHCLLPIFRDASETVSQQPGNVY